MPPVRAEHSVCPHGPVSLIPCAHARIWSAVVGSGCAAGGGVGRVPSSSNHFLMAVTSRALMLVSSSVALVMSLFLSQPGIRIWMCTVPFVVAGCGGLVIGGCWRRV